MCRRFSFRMTAINIHILYFRVVCWICLLVSVVPLFRQTRAVSFVRENVIDTRDVSVEAK